MSKFGYGVTEKVLRNLVQSVLEARAPGLLVHLDIVGRRILTQEEREALREVLSDEFVESGLGLEDEPNERGLLIEEAIGWLGSK